MSSRGSRLPGPFHGLLSMVEGSCIEGHRLLALLKFVFLMSSLTLELRSAKLWLILALEREEAILYGRPDYAFSVAGNIRLLSLLARVTRTRRQEEMMSKVKVLSFLPERAKVLLFSFSFGLFFGLLPVTVINLVTESSHFRVPAATRAASIYVGIASGVVSLLPGYLWWRRRAIRKTSRSDLSIFVWGLAWGVGVIAMITLALILDRHAPDFKEGVGWAVIIGIWLTPLAFTYGCFLGFLANNFLRFRFRDLIVPLFILGFVVEVVCGHDTLKYTHTPVESHKIEELARKGAIDQLIEYFGHYDNRVRSSAKEAILAMEHSVVVPALRDRMLKKGVRKLHDREVKTGIAYVLGAMDAEGTANILVEAYPANQNKFVRSSILRALRRKPKRKDLVPFLIGELNSKDRIVLGSAIRCLETVTDISLDYTHDDLRSKANEWRKWWESNRDSFLEDAE